ncbi:uncharacterized protein IL334_006832 [Kwoniella shivajii]|uniref:Peroxisome assembly protein 12 n=1 Tax=Kwoniella shivajii TaxID=564305 RepID=A0ABZ1D7Q2_9TREE|nr:hypothetical protein IL334_006832 [Kwoniella shivajii]
MQRTTIPIFPESGPSTDHSRPSLFDLLAQDQLRDLFHPVLRYILSYFAQRYPRYLLRILNHHEEFFAFLLWILERHHLKKHNASISEHFYGLRLTPSRNLATPRLDRFSQAKRKSISRKQRFALLVFLVGVPYVRARAQDYFERMGGGRNPDEIADEERRFAVTRSQKMFKFIYPYLSLGIDLTFLGYDIAYLFEKTRYPRPWHKWLGLKVVRRGSEDEVESSGILSKLPPLLPPLLLLLKLSQWWYSPSSPRSHPALSSNQNTIAATHASILPPRSLPILPGVGILPPSPPLTPTEEDMNSLETRRGVVTTDQSSASKKHMIGKEDYGNCPLCGNKWQNPAVLPSGWVVCWRCGWDAIEGEEEEEEIEHEEEKMGQELQEDIDQEKVRDLRKGRKGRCPITGVEVGPGELRRVLV